MSGGVGQLAERIPASGEVSKVFLGSFLQAPQRLRAIGTPLLRLFRKAGRALAGRSKTGLVIMAFVGIGLMLTDIPYDLGNKSASPAIWLGATCTLLSLLRHAQISRRRSDKELIRAIPEAKLIL